MLVKVESMDHLLRLLIMVDDVSGINVPLPDSVRPPVVTWKLEAIIL